jgi:hypothetical protein
MKFLIIILCPPLYLALRKKWGAFVLNAILYILAWATIVFFVGFIFYALAVGHAGWHLQRERMEEQAQLIAEKMHGETSKSE